MNLGDIIRQYRMEHHCSMEAFAAASGLSKGYISMLEKNENPKTKQPITPSIVTFKCVSLATGIDMNELLAMVDENQPVYLIADAEPKDTGTDDTKAPTDITAQEYQLIERYRAACPEDRQVVDLILEKYKK